jgi:hypothetical protein
MLKEPRQLESGKPDIQPPNTFAVAVASGLRFWFEADLDM